MPPPPSRFSLPEPIFSFSSDPSNDLLLRNAEQANACNPQALCHAIHIHSLANARAIFARLRWHHKCPRAHIRARVRACVTPPAAIRPFSDLFDAVYDDSVRPSAFPL